MTLHKEKHVTLLGLLIEKKKNTFIFRVYCTKGAQRKSFHTGAADKVLSYDDIWRLALRDELMIKTTNKSLRVGQTVRFDYNEIFYTIRITKTLSRSIKGIVVCGKQRGKERNFESYEMLNIREIFAWDILKSLYRAMEDAKWESGKNSKTKKSPRPAPSLKNDFKCDENEKYKRKWHFFKILGSGANLLCERTTERGKLFLKRSKTATSKKR